MIEIPLRVPAGLAPRVTLIDDEDLALVDQYQWRFLPERYGQTGGYAVARTRYRIYMHRLILGLTDDRALVGDHINRDGLDNCRANLRVLRAGENAQNCGVRADSSTGYRGVQHVLHKGRWQYRVQVGSRGNVRTRRVATLDEATAQAQAWQREMFPFADIPDTGHGGFPPSLP